MILRSLEEALESISALRGFAAGNPGVELDAEASKEAIASNLVAIGVVDNLSPFGDASLDDITNLQYGRYGSGILIASSGLVLTAYHIIAPHVEEWKALRDTHLRSAQGINAWLENGAQKYVIATPEGHSFPIDVTFWADYAAKDIALIKGIVPPELNPAAFKVATKDVGEGDTIEYVSLEKLAVRSGQGKVVSEDAAIEIKDTGEIYKGHFVTDAVGQKGYSGGAFVNASGEYCGMISSKYLEIEGHTGAHISDIRILAEKAADYIEQLISEN